MSSTLSELYNVLPPAEHAEKIIMENHGDFLEVLRKLQLVFSKPAYRNYGVWVAHRHFQLGNNEMMVTRRTGEKQWTMAPGPQVVAKAFRWTCKPNSTESLPLEFIDLNSSITIPEPPAELWKAFMKAIAGNNKFPLGICWLAFGEPLNGTQVFFETTHHTGRRHQYDLREGPHTSNPQPFTTAYMASPTSVLAEGREIDESDQPARMAMAKRAAVPAMEIHTQCLHLGK